MKERRLLEQHYANDFSELVISLLLTEDSLQSWYWVNTREYDHIFTIYSQMNEIWYIKGKFRVIPKPNNLFLLGFEHEEECRHVLKVSPWLVSNLHFCLKPWMENLILSQPLRPGVHVLDTEGKEIWLKFKYERLGEFCFRCGVILHPTYKCKKEKRPNEGKELPEDDSYGLWMRAREVNSKHYSGQKSFARTLQQVPLDATDATGERVPP
ncbi:hypothetical protein Tsubulata_013605 [Turnera subulata]|uniref:Zinc knuckle CX2CX4HX4C domain-containing protein n=1 Tax=Turnera subulata TaxID=218843 RepID=A0A9Q0FUU4_9ROSI|nr:hypothetical protein Tsubulata_013605 [Turnera subulata]